MGKREGHDEQDGKEAGFLACHHSIQLSIQVQWAGDVYESSALGDVENFTTACRFSGVSIARGLSSLKLCIEGIGAHLLIQHFKVNIIWK